MSPYPPTPDGIGEHAQAYVEQFCHRGHDVAVVSGRRHAEASGKVIAALPDRGLNVDPVLAAIRAWGPDVIHVQFAVASYGTQVPALLRLIRALSTEPVPVVVTLHELGRDTALLRGAGRSLYRRLVQDADHAIVLTDDSLERFRSVIGDSPVDLIPLPAAGLPTATRQCRRTQVALWTRRPTCPACVRLHPHRQGPGRSRPCARIHARTHPRRLSAAREHGARDRRRRAAARWRVSCVRARRPVASCARSPSGRKARSHERQPVRRLCAGG